MPGVADDEEGEDGGDQHGAGERNAVGLRQVAGGAEAEHRGEHHHQQEPVEPRDIDLAVRARRGLHDVEARQVAELDRLSRERRGAGDRGLRGDHGGCGGEDHHRIERPARKRVIEGIVDGGGIGDQQRALAEVVQHQRRQHHREPADADRTLAEVPHVGVERFGAGEGEQHRAEHHERSQRVAGQEAVRVARVDGGQHGRIEPDVPQAHRAEGGEPQQADRAEHRADLRGAEALQREQADQHHHRDRQHPALEQRRADFQPLDRRHHRDRRREHGLAEEQRRAARGRAGRPRCACAADPSAPWRRARAAPWCRPRRGCRRASPAPRT